MKNSILYYSVGALLYCPANRESIASSIMNEKFGQKYSLALCLEDTIKDDQVAEAEQQLLRSLTTIYEQHQVLSFYLPKIFIRVRNAEQIIRLKNELKQAAKIVTGFIIPKFSLETADEYIRTMIRINEDSEQRFYMMPIYENASIINLQNRYDILYTLKDKLKEIEELVLNIRVGGNDLCHAFGFRRHSDESIHKIQPVAHIFSDIVTVYGMDYVISGPVWEYFNGPLWDEGLKNELIDDRLCGFTGKTVIHPKQIELVNAAYQVSQKDFDDAKAILNWDDSNSSMVAGSIVHERMNEYKTHFNWAEKIMMLANTYGIQQNVFFTKSDMLSYTK